MSVISFFIPMKPEAKQGDRSRIVKPKFGKEFVAHYKDKKVEQAENWIAINALPHAPAIPMDGPLFAILKAYTIPPDSYSAKKKAACLSMDMWPTGRPDIDNSYQNLYQKRFAARAEKIKNQKENENV